MLVLGGDGTFSEVVTGLLAADLGGYVELALLPLGTGGDLARTLGIPSDLSSAIAAIPGAPARTVDAGCIRFQEGDRERRRYFANVASIGISGMVTELVNRTSKKLGGRLSFLTGTLPMLHAGMAPFVWLWCASFLMFSRSRPRGAELRRAAAWAASGLGLCALFAIWMRWGVAVPAAVEPFVSADDGGQVAHNFMRYTDVHRSAPDWSSAAYGLHLVRVLARTEPTLPAFDELRERLSSDYKYETRQAANALALERLTQRYQILEGDS